MSATAEQHRPREGSPAKWNAMHWIWCRCGWQTRQERTLAEAQRSHADHVHRHLAMAR